MFAPVVLAAFMYIPPVVVIDPDFCIYASRLCSAYVTRLLMSSTRARFFVSVVSLYFRRCSSQFVIHFPSFTDPILLFLGGKAKARKAVVIVPAAPSPSPCSWWP